MCHNKIHSHRNAVDKFLKRRLGWMPARTALAIISWFGFINLYMTRINLHIAIVAMVKRNVTSGSAIACDSLSRASDSQSNAANGTSADASYALKNEEGELLWDETTQGIVLGSFFYGYALTQIIGGRMAELHGTKLVYGICILAGGISALLSPAMAKFHYGALVALRAIQGAFQGVAWPSMHACISRWIPPVERPKFIAIVYMASTLSSVLTMPIAGVIIGNHGWEAQFYVMGVLSIVWCCIWFSLMYNSPEEHPRISCKELEFIQKALKESGTQKSSSERIPWRDIFSSLPMWAILFYSLGNGWGISLFFSQLPTYMKNVLGFSIKSNGVLSATPFFCRYLGGIAWSNLASWLLTRGYLSIRTTRRIFSAVSLWGPGAMVLGVSFSGCRAEVTVVLFCLALFFNGAATCSGFVNHTDIAPNFAGTLLGIDNTLGSIIAFTVPLVTGVMTDGQQTLEAWQRVFWVCIPIYVVAEVFFLIFVSGEVQPWNDIDMLAARSRGKTKSPDAQQVSEELPLHTVK